MTLKSINRKYPDQVAGTFFVLPQLILFVCFMGYPVFEGVRLSFYEIGFRRETWVGLANYISVLHDEIFILALKNTIIFCIFTTFFTILIGVLISAAIFDKPEGYISFIRVTYYIPTIVSMVVMTIIWKWLLQPEGLLNYFSKAIGMGSINFLSDKNIVLPVIIFIAIISNIGRSIILFVAAMIGIPTDIFDSASIDGANRWQQFKYVTIPLIIPTMLFVVITTTIATLKVFSIIQLLTDGGPNHYSETMMYHLYARAFMYNDLGPASVIGNIMFIISLFFALIQFKVLKNRV
ncbi:MAG: sugar ABC transporter permease [Spirochaetales bacterium]|nr:sugar ABC transporter permease [Spirochaetales bacterium]